ncbi:unnamed protein product [Thelazia callipaeda]|uniref:DUF4210 domain-containing protein n=1 Tax=Thelazia callipaeda TaxID=103827 RepID=A0A0N5CZN1_THECL|nr:unnamed protein product [Thelazia callipaeda]
MYGYLLFISPYVHSYSRTHRFCKSSSNKEVKVDDRKIIKGNGQSVKSVITECLSDSRCSSVPFEDTSLQRVTTVSTLHREVLLPGNLYASTFKTVSKGTDVPLTSNSAPSNDNSAKIIEQKINKRAKNETILKKTTKIKSRTANVKVIDNDYYINKNIFTRRRLSSCNGLLCNFEESALNGRLEPVTSLDGFSLQIAASDTAHSPHLTLPATTLFFSMPDDEAPSPFLAVCSLEHMRRGYRIPKKGFLQAVLFNPQGTVVRMFLIKFDVSDMPPSSHTFLRQRTSFMPTAYLSNKMSRSLLKHLIHLSLATDRRGRLYIHNDIKMLFSQKNDLEILNLELGKNVNNYQLQSSTEMPQNPKYSPYY